MIKRIEVDNVFDDLGSKAIQVGIDNFILTIQVISVIRSDDDLL